MGFAQTIYELSMYGARPLLAAATPLSSKLRKGVQGRRGATERLIAWANATRDASRPLVWLHAPSVGESLMAQAIVAELRAQLPEAQIVFTYFSPSAERIAERVGADIADYLPWDTPRTINRTLSALKPSAIAFVRTEIWPTLVRIAAERSIPMTLVNAVLSPESSRLHGTARWLLGPAYARLDRVGAVARPDAERFSRLGVSTSRVRVTGDARFDQVHARVQALDTNQPLLHRLRDDRVLTVVAGSTWPSDEEEILPAYAHARKGSPLRLIIAPHEPDAAHLRELEQRLTSAGLRHNRLSEIESSGGPLPEVVVVDRVGILADLYAIASIAYVGGGFHSAGLHSVVEPAGQGVPTIFGPRHGNAREADELAGKGGGFVASDGATFASVMLDLAARPLHRKSASLAARGFVEARLGGARRNAEMIVALIRK
ncbi:MAG TPA: glycosyltransferase N-terminal domain-containing protein [Longimicrobiales bacterium]